MTFFTFLVLILLILTVFLVFLTTIVIYVLLVQFYNLRTERDKAVKTVNHLVFYTLSLYDYLDSPSNDSKVALQTTWKRLPVNVQQALASIKHLIEP